MLTPIATDLPSSENDEIQREAYNAAFYELGLAWHWDVATYHSLLLADTEPGARVRRYLETQQPHMLKVYDAGFLVEAIEAAKKRCLENIEACGGHGAPHVNWAEFQRMQVGS